MNGQNENGLAVDTLNSANKPLWTWQNITRNVTSASTDSAWNSPFTISLDDSIYGPVLEVLFYSPRAIGPYGSSTNPSAGVLDSVYSNNSFDLRESSHRRYSKGEILIVICNTVALPSLNTPPDLFPTEETSVKTDLLLAVTYLSTNLSGSYLLWVNATTLVTVNLGPMSQGYSIDGPLSAFPFARLATTTPVGSRAFYLYHQLSESILAEEIFDSSHFVWTSSNISIAIR